jgi:polysaccharide biosynthesis/export protein
MRTVNFLILAVGLVFSGNLVQTLHAQVQGGSAPNTILPMPPSQLERAPTLPIQKQDPSSTPPEQGYILGLEDVLQVDILGRSDFSTKAIIGTDGKIQLPLLGPTPAADRTVLQLRGEIARALQLGGFFTKPIVEVQVVSYASRYVTVLGAVGTPGLIPVDRPYRLSEILARVGGVKEIGADYAVLRTKEGEKNYSVKELATGDSNSDPYVQPGDKIFVPNADMFYIKGQVKDPGGYPLPPHMTLVMALARGGGLTDLGSDRHITITRKNAEIDPKNLNVEILPDDVIDVGEGWF